MDSGRPDRIHRRSPSALADVVCVGLQFVVGQGMANVPLWLDPEDHFEILPFLVGPMLGRMRDFYVDARY